MPHGTSKNEYPQSDNVGAGSAPTDNLVKCGHSSFFNF